MPVAGDLYYHAFEGGTAETPALVLIHGAAGNHLYWPSEVRRLPGQRVYAVDLPGHGKSEGRGQQSIEAYARQVAGWLDALKIGRAVLAGHSMGAAIALHMALDDPDQIAGVVLVGAGARLPVHPDILAHSESPTTFHKAVEALITYAFGAAAESRLIEMAAARMLETRPSVLHGDLLACDAFDVTMELERVSQPTLIVCGMEDRLTPLRYSQFLTSAIPNARFEMIKQAGHMVMLEKPAEVADCILKFLAAHWPHIVGEESIRPGGS